MRRRKDNKLSLSTVGVVKGIRKEMPPPSKILVDKRVRQKHDKVGRKAKYRIKDF